jgi:hypothetical protein
MDSKILKTLFFLHLDATLRFQGWPSYISAFRVLKLLVIFFYQSKDGLKINLILLVKSSQCLTLNFFNNQFKIGLKNN